MKYTTVIAVTFLVGVCAAKGKDGGNGGRGGKKTTAPSGSNLPSLMPSDMPSYVPSELGAQEGKKGMMSTKAPSAMMTGKGTNGMNGKGTDGKKGRGKGGMIGKRSMAPVSPMTGKMRRKEPRPEDKNFR